MVTMWVSTKMYHIYYSVNFKCWKTGNLTPVYRLIRFPDIDVYTLYIVSEKSRLMSHFQNSLVVRSTILETYSKMSHSINLCIFCFFFEDKWRSSDWTRFILRHKLDLLFIQRDDFLWNYRCADGLVKHRFLRQWTSFCGCWRFYYGQRFERFSW